jgi:hypothetical protein
VVLDWETLSIALLAVGGLSWAAYRVCKSKTVDHDFSCVITGERFGEIQIELDGRIAKAEYDVGMGVDYVINVSNVAWVDGISPSAEERLEMIDQLKRWASSRGSSIEFVDDAQRI